MYKSALAALAFGLSSLAAGHAVADTTLLRCFYKTSADSTNTDFSYEWGLKTSSSSLPVTLSGNWWKSAAMNDPANMFFTNTSQATLKSYCQNAFTKKGIARPLMRMAAGATSNSLNYTIWSNDLSSTQPAKISKVAIFGDSASDDQNLYSGSQHLMPYEGSWFLGHFTNGWVWNEYLTNALNLPNYNWAVAGAAADDYYVIPGVDSQVDSYLAYMQSALNYQPANTLFAVFIGGNDLVNYGRSVDSILAKESSALTKLINSGARHILLLNLPPFDRAPAFVDAYSTRTDAAVIRAQVLDYNARLVTLRNQLVSQYGANGIALNIHIYDTKAQVDDLLNNPASYGRTNATDSCLALDDSDTSNYLTDHARRAGCTNADTYVFWDRLHPSTASHKLIALGHNGIGGLVKFVQARYPL
ncbi:MAG: SGNH/GDSL hydrolase family protein [Pseudomonadota bacterium]